MGARLLGWPCSLSRLSASIMENVNGESMFVSRKTRPRGMVEWKADGIFPCADRKTKDIKMPPFLLVLLLLVIFVCAFGYMTYRHEAEKRAWEKKRNQFNDRV